MGFSQASFGFNEATLTSVSYILFFLALWAYIGHLLVLAGGLSRRRIRQREQIDYGGVQPAFAGGATLVIGGRTGTAGNISAAAIGSAGEDEDLAADGAWSWFGRSGFALALSAWLALTLALALRWQTSGHPPWVSLYEVTMMLSWGSAALYLLIVEAWMRVRSVGAFVLLIVFMLQSYGLLIIPADQKVATPLIPALRSDWLLIHVSMAIIAYSSFGVAAGAGITYLLKHHKPGRWARVLPSAAAIDEFMFRAVAIGFPFQTLLLITGAYWAQVAWSKAWSWDPKEVWALITWLYYAGMLHIRVQRGWRGPTVAWMSIVGFIVVLIAFVGVNYLVSWARLQSMHTYAGSDTPGLFAFIAFAGFAALLLGGLVAHDVRRLRRSRPRAEQSATAQPQSVAAPLRGKGRRKARV